MPRQLFGRCAFLAALAALLASLLLASGCSKSSAPNENAAAAPEGDSADAKGTSAASASAASGSPAKAPQSAKEVLQAASQRYLAARTYADVGQLTLRAVVGGEKIEQQIPFAVAFERPGKLRLHAYEGTVISDGEQIYGLHESLPRYAIVQPAPVELSLQDVYADEFMRIYLTEREAGSVPQLPLLLAPTFVDDMIKAFGEPKLGEPAAVDDELCDAVRFTLPARTDQSLTYWIGRESRLLRRIDLPVPDGLFQNLSQFGKVEDVEFRAHLVGARFDQPIDAPAFQVELGEGMKQVKRFVEPLPPVLGKPVNPFEITRLTDSAVIGQQSLEGKVTVIDLWATWCQPCLQNMPKLAELAEHYQDNDKVLVLAVSVDRDDVEDAEITSALAKAGPSLTAYRDVGGRAAGAICQSGQIQLPTTILIGPDGVVQEFEIGVNPASEGPESLRAKVDALLAGQSLVQEKIAQFEEAMQSEPSPQAVAAVPAAPRSSPRHVELEPAWTNAEGLLQPGNVYVVQQDDGPHIYVIDNFSEVIELDGAGTVVQRHDLELPAEAPAPYLRTAVDGAGQRLFALVSQMHVFVFDDQWKLKLKYPEHQDHPGISDARLADMDGDGQLDLVVSYFDVAGVQLASLEGQRLWSNSSLRDVFGLEITNPAPSGERFILCTHSRGTVAVITHDGNREKDVPIYNVQFVKGAELTPGEPLSYSAWGLAEDGGSVFVGMSLASGERWTYPLPRGPLHPVLERTAHGRLVGSLRHWIVAGSDSSLHFVGDDGALLDRFNYGAPFSGFAAAEVDGQPLLVVATADKVEAWHVRPKSAADGAEAAAPKTARAAVKPADEPASASPKADDQP